MLQRVFVIFLTALLEAARSPLAWVGGILLLVVIPVATHLVGGSETETGVRVWLCRSLISEGLRWLLPIAAFTASAYLIRPSLKRGWAILPARRSEWFIASSLAVFVATAFATVLLSAGGAVASMALGDASLLDVTRLARTLDRRGSRSDLRASDQDRLFVFPNGRETLVFEFDAEGLGEVLRGKLQFEIGWMGEIAPEKTTPLEVRLIGDRTVTAITHVEARRRATFEAENPGGRTIRVECRGIDPALSVGMKRDECRLLVRREDALPSFLWLALGGLGGALLCASVTLGVRSLATAPTAALAGALVFSALTLLPALAGGDLPARKRREAVEGARPIDRSTAQSLAETLSEMPALIEPRNFERLMAGEAAGSDDADSALLRLLLAAGLLPVGAILFGRREVL